MNDKKQKRICVSLATKRDALRRLKNGEPYKCVAADLGVTVSTLSGWHSQRHNIESWLDGESSESWTKKTMKKRVFEKTASALYNWYTQLEERSTITSSSVQEKAKELNKIFDEGKNFQASNGWLQKWKRRYGVKFTADDVTAPESVNVYQENSELIEIKTEIKEEEYDESFNTTTEVVTQSYNLDSPSESIDNDNVTNELNSGDERSYMIGRLVAVKLARIPNPSQRNLAEKLINSVLFLAELGQLEMDHVDFVRKGLNYDFEEGYRLSDLLN